MRKFKYIIFGIIVVASTFAFPGTNGKVIAQSACTISTDTFISPQNTTWCDGQDVIIKSGANVFLNGVHHFKSLTVENGASLGTVQTNNSFAVRWKGYIDVPANAAIGLYGVDGVRLGLRNVNGNSWIWNSNWTNNCGLNCDRIHPSTASSPSNLSAGLYEIEIDYIGGANGSGTDYLNLMMSTTTDNSRGEPVTSIVDLRDKRLYTTQNKTNSGLTKDSFAWADYNQSDPNVSFAQDHLISERNDNGSSIYTPNYGDVTYFGLDYGDHQGLSDPFISQTMGVNAFANLSLTVDNDVRIDGTMMVEGGNAGGPYVTKLSPNSTPDFKNLDLDSGKISLIASNINGTGSIYINGRTVNHNWPGHGDGGNGGIIDLTATNAINFNHITADGGNGSTGYYSGGGGSAGIIIANANTVAISSIEANGGSGSQYANRPGRSLFSPYETLFANDAIPGCWRNGGTCYPYNTYGSNACNASSGCFTSVAPASECSQWGGAGGETSGGAGISPSGGAGGGGLSDCQSTAGGGGGGVGGVAIVNVSPDNSFQGNASVSGGNGGGAVHAVGGNGGPGIKNNTNKNSYTLLENVSSLIGIIQNNPANNGETGNNGGQYGGHGGGGGGGGGSGGVINLANNFQPPSPPTLTATLTATPTSGDVPLPVTFEAKAESNDTTGAPLNYYFWWNCANTSTNVADVIADPQCQNPGAKYEDVQNLTQPASHTYTVAGPHTAKVIIIRGSAPNATAPATITANTPQTPCTPLSPQTQTLACPAGQTGQITQTRTSTCPGPTWSAWTTTQNTCAAPPPTPTPSLDCTVSFEEGGESVKIKGSLVSDTICFKPRKKGSTGYSVSIYSDAKVLNSSLPGFENLMKVIIGY